jgi:hypothetical protein
MTEFSDPGPLPELAWLPIDKLRVNSDYQRLIGTPRSQALIHQIAQDFQWLAFQSIQATPDDNGGWYVIDGQHRVEAARRRNFTLVPATVVAAATVAQQADAFVRANRNRIPINQFAVFHALVTSGDPTATQLAAICRRAAIVIPRSTPSASDMPAGVSLAIGTLLALTRRHDSLVHLPIHAVAEAYRAIKGALRAPFFDGAARYIFSLPSEQRDEAIARANAFFASKHPDDLFASIAGKVGQGGATSRGQAIAALIRASCPAPIEIATRRVSPPALKKVGKPAVKANLVVASESSIKRAPAIPASAPQPRTPSALPDDVRFAKLLHQGSPIERVATAFGLSVDEAKRRAQALGVRL